MYLIVALVLLNFVASNLFMDRVNKMFSSDENLNQIKKGNLRTREGSTQNKSLFNKQHGNLRNGFYKVKEEPPRNDVPALVKNKTPIRSFFANKEKLINQGNSTKLFLERKKASFCENFKGYTCFNGCIMKIKNKRLLENFTEINQANVGMLFV
jgi:hypothetical protein